MTRTSGASCLEDVFLIQKPTRHTKLTLPTRSYFHSHNGPRRPKIRLGKARQLVGRVIVDGWQHVKEEEYGRAVGNDRSLGGRRGRRRKVDTCRRRQDLWIENMFVLSSLLCPKGLLVTRTIGRGADITIYTNGSMGSTCRMNGEKASSSVHEARTVGTNDAGTMGQLQETHQLGPGARD
jgi:hypothetical protein